MQATILYQAGEVRVENIPDASIKQPTDALIRVARACICGSDLWPYRLMESGDAARPMGHEAIGVVEAVGKDVRTIKAGDVVVIREGSSAENGEIVVAAFHDQNEYSVTLKRFRRRGTAIALEAANPDYETRVLPADQVEIQGKLVGLIRTY